MAFPDHLLTLATLRLLTLTPLASSYNQQPSLSTSASIREGSTSSNDRFHSVRSQPLRILSELTAAYLQLLGNAAKSHAEQAGRTTCNALDAREAIEQFGGSIEEVDEWARECQLDRGILSSNDDLITTTAAANAATPATPGDRGGGDDPNDLGTLLKDTARNVAYRPPTQVIEYAPLTDREAAIVTAVQHNDSLLPFLPYDLQQQVNKEQSNPPYLSPSSSEDNAPSPSSSRAISPPPPSYNEATSNNTTLSLRKREKSRAYDDHIIDGDNDPLSFLPPFPDLDATQTSLQQTIIEDESGRIVKRARRALDTYLNATTGGAGSISKKNASIAWLRAVPYDVSSLAEYEGGKFSVPSMKKDSRKKKKKTIKGEARNYSDEDEEEEDEEEEDALTASSLPYFLETFNWISLDYEQQGDSALLPLRHNSKRKRAATAIHSNILNPSDDSLSGAIPALPPRHAKKQAGWIPYPPINPEVQDPTEPGGKAIRPFPVQLHPFSTQLPASITEPVPQLVLPHASRVLAPPMHPRYPMAHTSIRTLLESSSPALFARTTRIGPPGPLLENGGAGAYQVEAEKPVIPGWPGDAMPRMMGWNFDWEIGNELEDGIKERKAAGIQDVAVHEQSSLYDDGSNTPGPSGASTSANGPASWCGNANVKEEYKGPPFPPLPIRPPYDPLQASLNAQKEEERKREEEAMTFQEVQEDRESERLHELEVARVAAEEEAERARGQKEREEIERKRIAEEEERKRKEAEQVAKKEAEKPKIVPKLSFSLKLGGGGTSSTAPAPAGAAAAATTPLAAISATPPLVTPAPAPSTSELLASTAQSSSLTAQPAAPQQDASATASESQSTNIWNTGIALEQDYRAPAADITHLAQPPLILPGTATSTPLESSTSSPTLTPFESTNDPPSEAVVQEAAAPVLVDPALQEEAEVDAEGDEEDAENESEDDDLFDEVEVDHSHNDSTQQGMMEGDAVYATSPAYQNAGTNHNPGEMHVEVEEMDM